MLNLGSKTKVVELGFVGVDLPKVCGDCRNRNALSSYLILFVEGGDVASFHYDMG